MTDQPEDPKPKRKRRPRIVTPAALRTKNGGLRKIDGPRGGPKPDAARIKRVEDLMREGVGDSKVWRIIVEEFGVTERTVQSDCARVWAEWHDAASGDRTRRVARALRNMRHLQKRAEHSDDAGIPGAAAAAIAAADKANKIEGVYAPDALKILQGEMEGMQRLSAEDLDAEIERELVKMLGGLTPERRAVVLQNAGVGVLPSEILGSLPETRVPWPALSGIGEPDVFKEPYPVAPGADEFAKKLNQTLYAEPVKPKPSKAAAQAKKALAKRRGAKET